MLVYFINNNSNLQQEPKLKVPLTYSEIEKLWGWGGQKCINIGLRTIVESMY